MWGTACKKDKLHKYDPNETIDRSALDCWLGSIYGYSDAKGRLAGSYTFTALYTRLPTREQKVAKFNLTTFRQSYRSDDELLTELKTEAAWKALLVLEAAATATEILPAPKETLEDQVWIYV